MESPPSEPFKRARSVTEAELCADQERQESMVICSESQRPRSNRLLPNELVREICCAIPAVNASHTILLTARNMHTYLAAKFRKQILIYRDAIAFLRAKADEQCSIEISIDRRVARSNTNGHIVIHQGQSIGKFGTPKFQLKTNQLHIRMRAIQCAYSTCWLDDEQLESAHMHYFLRLIAPLLQPIALCLIYTTHQSVERSMRFLNTQRCCIGPVELRSGQFNAISEPLANYNSLHILGPLGDLEVPKFIQWLTAKKKGAPKKCFFTWVINLDDGQLTRLLDAIETDFVGATSTCQFVVRLKLRDVLIECTVRNECTRERLELRCMDARDGVFAYALSRNLDNSDAEKQTLAMLNACGSNTVIVL